MYPHFVPVYVHSDWSDFQQVSYFRKILGAAQNCGDSRQEFPETIGLSHVIICAQFQTDNHINHVIFSGNHNDGGVVVFTHLAANLGSGKPWEHQIQ